ncbi:assimilatory sulfite reductase (NADPH) hemoprotein subunit [Aerolutibacter ruishenii]|uniref:Sulfite reductase [NADPH] hemoprotein beta-component n=1 Tax=Aerolutibacter ruishenii TaxID=686800 RepID=A0A562LPE1_9GAMM|nr:assimilatory sulfite reductase (NADPH) hemoprotein subunit [Lysobacter ruishenii]TWI09487.1 sulfite reductase (NADPH) beta subunit [Lysobacter ruishenii]
MSTHSVEDIKLASRRLRGSLLESLANPVTGALADDDTALIKFHGSYQQDDRDIREERRLQKLEPAYSFMIRTRTPGGVVTPEQWLQLDRVATTYAERGLRITTRQAFQFHGVIKSELKPTLQAINAAMINTIAACGDINRNVVAAANPHLSRAHAAVHAQAAAISTALLPRSRAYYEIWLDEEKVAGSGEEEEPVYGPTYLPRKFKIGFAIPPFNDIDVFAQDLGFTAVLEQGELLGYNVSVGGGLGATHGDPDTYPRLASVLGFVPADRVQAVTEAVVTTQRDWGDRTQRKRARLKYTLDERGVDAFKAEVERRAGLAFEPARLAHFQHNGDRFGWVQSEDDPARWHLTLRIIAGRIWDRHGASHLTGLREIATLLRDAVAGSEATTSASLPPPEFRMTANQNLVIANVPDALREKLAALVARHRLDIHATASPTRLNAVACVALPTCGLAMAEAERYLPDFIDRLEALLDRHGLRGMPINVRISGCPNGCSRPYLGEIALVGKAPGRYNLMLGADHRGQRLNTLYRENVDEATMLAALDPLLGDFAAQRAPGEHFGDYLLRAAVVSVPARDIRTIDVAVVA